MQGEEVIREILPRSAAERTLTPPGCNIGQATSPVPTDASRRAVSPRFAATSPRFQAPAGASMRHLEELDSKFANQLAQAQQRADQARERLRTWMEQKMQSILGAQTKSDMRVAELGGNMAALSDEMQSQVRRSEQTDMKYWEWRKDFEEEIRSKLSELEAKVDEVGASFKTQQSTSERVTTRVVESVRVLETVVGEQGRHLEELLGGRDFEGLAGRVVMLEEQNLQIMGAQDEQSRTLEGMGSIQRALAAEQERLLVVERQLAENDRVNADVRYALSDINSRLEAHEEKIRATRTVIDQQRELVQSTRAKLESLDVDGKVDAAVKAVASSKEKAEGSFEKVGKLSTRVDVLEESLDSLRSLTISGTSPPWAVPVSAPPMLISADDGLQQAERRSTSGYAEAVLAADSRPPRSPSASVTSAARIAEPLAASPAVLTPQLMSPPVVLERIPGAVLSGVSASPPAPTVDGILTDRLEELLQKLSSVGPTVVRHEEILRDLVSRNQLPAEASTADTLVTSENAAAKEQLERLAARMEAMTATPSQ